MNKTLYAYLGVLPHASDAEIHTAYQKLSKDYAAATSGLDPAEADLRLKMLTEAFWTLSDANRRAAYDAGLIARALPPRLEVEIREPRWSPQKILILAIGSLFLVGMIIQIGFMLMSYRYSSKALSEAEVRQKEYELTTGESRAENATAAAERKAEQEARQREMQEERDQRKRERDLEESRRYAERVSSDLARGEEKARRDAEYAQQKAAGEEQRRKQEEERTIQRRLDDEKRRLRELEIQNRRNY